MSVRENGAGRCACGWLGAVGGRVGGCGGGVGWGVGNRVVPCGNRVSWECAANQESGLGNSGTRLVTQRSVVVAVDDDLVQRGEGIVHRCPLGALDH